MQRSSTSSWLNPVWPTASLTQEDRAFVQRLGQCVQGVSFAELSRQLNMNRETLRRLIRSGTPNLELIVRLCERYDISADWLLLGRGESPPALEAGIAALGAAAAR